MLLFSSQAVCMLNDVKIGTWKSLYCWSAQREVVTLS